MKYASFRHKLRLGLNEFAGFEKFQKWLIFKKKVSVPRCFLSKYVSFRNKVRLGLNGFASHLLVLILETTFGRKHEEMKLIHRLFNALNFNANDCVFCSSYCSSIKLLRACENETMQAAILVS